MNLFNTFYATWATRSETFIRRKKVFFHLAPKSKQNEKYDILKNITQLLFLYT